MKFLKLLAALVLFIPAVLLFPTLTSAATVLNPGSTIFSTASIVFQGLQVSGSLDYLRVYWDASYLSKLGPLGVTCYLNCNPLEEVCIGRQNCTYIGPAGPALCSIQPVSYAYPLDTPQNATCIFYDPSKPEVEYLKYDLTYPNTTFKPLDFILYISQNFTVNLEKQFSMQINVKNVGVFIDNFTIRVNPNPANLVNLDERTRFVTVGPLTGNSYGNIPETFASIAKMRVLSTVTPINIIVQANSTTNNTVFRQQVVQIRAGVSSLPDFGLFGLMQIIIVAGLILFLKLK